MESHLAVDETALFCALHVALKFSEGVVIRPPLQQLYSSVLKTLVGEIMNHLKLKLFVLIALSILAVQPAFASDGPELPPECGTIVPEAGNEVAHHLYAKGVQVYKWNFATMTWDFVAPRADLFAEDSYHGEVGSHFSGPNWQSKGGSRVKAAPILGKTCTPDTSAIAWLLLKATETPDKGIFKGVTFIQRVNTTGGLRPTVPGLFADEIKEVEYTAEYYFY